MRPQQVSRKIEPGIGFWLIAVLITILAHAFWLWGMEWRVPEVMTEAPSPARWVLQFWDEEQHSDAFQDQLAIASPTLFALPGSVGFSQAWLADEIAVRPPVAQPPEITMQLARQRPADEQGIVPLPDRDALLAEVSRHPLPIPRPSPQRAGANDWPDPVPSVIELRGAEDRMAESLAWPAGTTYWGADGWRAGGMITIDQSGTVTHVVLDQRPDEADVAHQLVRALHRWRWRPSDQPSLVHFIVSYPGAPRTTMAEESDER